MKPPSHRPHGIIIGGGIGGMALGAALERVGISFEIHEQAEELREIGAGLTLWSNALLALKRLDAAERVMALGSREDRFEIRSSSGRVWAVMPLTPAMDRLGLPAVFCIHRADLLRELVKLSPANRVNLRSPCVSIEDNGKKVIARFTNGKSSEGDFLVGADGLHSVVRAQLLGPSKPRYGGYTCWRAIAPLDPTLILPPNTAFEAWGRGRRFSIHPCGTGRVFWFATGNRPANIADALHGRRLEVQELFSSWHEPIPSVIAAASEILRNDIYDRAPVKAWGRGRITLLGDAAHPTTPNLGQGACQALEDAVVLADQLRTGPAIEPALRQYEKMRGPRTSLITRESYRLGRISQSENRMVGWAFQMAVQAMPPRVCWWSFERFLKTELPVL